MNSRSSQLQISFDSGTLILQNVPAQTDWGPVPDCRWDKRIQAFRLPAQRYFELLSYLHGQGLPYQDEARQYEVLQLQPAIQQLPFPYQQQALDCWRRHRKRGYIVLPTGAGKSYVGILAIMAAARSTLVMVPTIDLMNQWYDLLKLYFDVPIGLLGGGYHEVQALTVSTYDSAYIHMEKLGNRFGLLLFDECHHLPGSSYQLAARCAIAPFRLGLSATPERQDGRHQLLPDLIGPCVYRKNIRELTGSHLAQYEVNRIFVTLTAQEQALYEQERAIYLAFLKRYNIRMSAPRGWHNFLFLSSQSQQGRRAFWAYRRQKMIVQATTAKLEVLGRLLHKHRHDRLLIFTNDNQTVYTISERFLIPAITHQTLTKERREILLRFNQGTYPALVTSKVLNEGINVPEANVGVVLSGSGSVREHVQRLGRILRKRENKRAILYEVVAAGTGEEFVSHRRREHDAYR